MKITQSSSKNLQHIKRVGIVLKPNASALKTYVNTLISKLNTYDVEVFLDDKSASYIDAQGINFETLCAKVDFIISLGGDGTLISTARRSFRYNKPVLGINAGNLGFLADITIDKVELFLEQLFNNFTHNLNASQLTIQ